MNITDYRKLVFSINEIDPITGVYYFNGCSKTYYVEEEGELGYPKVLLTYQWKDIFKTNKNVYNDRINTPFIQYATYKNVQDISEHKKYFYMIMFYSVDFIVSNKNIGFRCVPDHVLDDVRNGKATIVLNNPIEGYSGCNLNMHGDELDIIQTWIDNSNIPSSQVIYINGNLLSDKIKSSNVQYRVEGICITDGWLMQRYNIDLNTCSIINFKPVDHEYLYLNMTRDPRLHRMYLHSKLVADDLFDYGKNSFNIRIYGDNHDNYAYSILKNINASPEILAGAKMIDSMGVKFIDIDTTDVDRAVTTINKTNYEQTFLSIISETIVVKNSILISEKTWKAVLIGHPFMLVSSKGSLKQLQEMGYRTFSKWIDESYDDVDTFQERIEIITNNLKKLKEKSLEELINIRNEMNEICMFNQNYFINEIRRKYFVDDKFLQDKPVLDILMGVLE